MPALASSMKPLFRYTLVLAVSAAVASHASAQTIPSPYRPIEHTQSAGVFGGYLWTGAADLDLGPSSAPLVGARYTIRFSGPAAGEVSVGYAPSERTVFRNDAVLGAAEAAPVAVGTADFPLLLAEAGIRFTLTGARSWNGLAPFLVATGGVVTPLDDSEGDIEVTDEERFDFGPAFAVGVGGGVDWFLGDRFAVRLDARDHLWKIPTPAGLADAGREDSQWTNNLSVTLGAALYF